MVEVRSSSRNPEVRRRVNADLTVTLDAHDACQATFDAAQERVEALNAAEKQAYTTPVELLPADTEEYRQLCQHRNAHALLELIKKKAPAVMPGPFSVLRYSTPASADG